MSPDVPEYDIVLSLITQSGIDRSIIFLKPKEILYITGVDPIVTRLIFQRSNKVVLFYSSFWNDACGYARCDLGMHTIPYYDLWGNWSPLVGKSKGS